jgi:hypothetical protein
MYDNMWRLYPRGAANRGICVDAEGAMLGPDCVLVRRTPHGFRAIPGDEAAALQKCLLDSARDRDWLFSQCRRIADALDQGELALAQIYALRIPIDDLDERQLARIAIARLIKAGFNPDQPRVPKGEHGGGEWTDGSGGGDAPAAASSDQSRPDAPAITWEVHSPNASDRDRQSNPTDESATTGVPESIAVPAAPSSPGRSEGIEPVYPLENLLLLLGTGGTSGALLRALQALGIRRGEGFVAHHIVAKEALRADPARKILERLGIGIHDAANGTILRQRPHYELHTHKYYDAVKKALSAASTKSEAEEILRAIARALEMGTFP